jgi:cyanophycin synthetase
MGTFMELVEIRDLDGPNMFALRPVIKLEVKLETGDAIDPKHLQHVIRTAGVDIPSEPAAAISALILHLHKRLKLTVPELTINPMDTEQHISICFSWENRYVARGIAQLAFQIVSGEQITDLNSQLSSVIAAETDPDDPVEPTWIRDEERRIPVAAITGTNGKTTTTRLLAHILRSTGKSVGWSSSSGVYINGVQVIEGDYTGHGGARRVLTDPEVDVGVLETARGGILLRGLGYESNDVGVLLNVGADHLDLHGVRTIETLASVKATVIRTTRPEGAVVLNADDQLVLQQKADVRASIILTSQNPDNPAIDEHLGQGGRCVVLEDGMITLCHGDLRELLVEVELVPLTYGGMARHMVENTLAATAAAVGLGLAPEDIADALRSFQPDRDHNAGRLNVFELGEVTVVVDFAHNESGLTYLLEFARKLFPETCRLSAIIGTAGDRQESVFIGLGRIAGTGADRVLIKSNPKYLRGRTPEAIIRLVRSGLEDVGALDREGGVFTSEFDAVVGAIESSVPGEVIVAMCVEDHLEIMDELIRRGAKERAPA